MPGLPTCEAGPPPALSSTSSGSTTFKRKCTIWPKCPSSVECGKAPPGPNEDPLKWPALREQPSIKAPSSIIPLSDRQNMISRSIAVSYTPPSSSIPGASAGYVKLPPTTPSSKASSGVPGLSVASPTIHKPVYSRSSSGGSSNKRKPGHLISRESLCFDYPFCFRGRSCTFLHPHEAKNGQNIDNALAGCERARLEMRVHQSKLNERINAEKRSKRRKDGRVRSARIHSLPSRISGRASSPALQVEPLARDIPFNSSYGFRTDSLRFSDAGLVAQPFHQTRDTFTPVVDEGTAVTLEESTESANAEGGVDARAEWEMYGEEVSMES